MPRTLRILLISFSLLISLALTGCTIQDILGNKKQPATKSNQQQPIIAVVLNEEDPNKKLIEQGIMDMAEKEQVQVKFFSPDGQEQSSTGKPAKKDEQSNQAAEKSGNKGAEAGSKEAEAGNKGTEQAGSEQALSGAKVLIYQGESSPVLNSAQEQKLPVLALGQPPAGVKPEGIILPDPQKIGQLMAQILVSQTKEGEVVVLQGDPADGRTQELWAANQSILNNYPKLTLKIISSPAGMETMAGQAFQAYLQQNSSKLSGVLAYSEKLAALANQILRAEQLEKKVVLVGSQANLNSLERMGVGGQLGDIDTSPYLQGVNAYQWAVKIINQETQDITDSITSEQGELAAKVVPVKAVTAENLALVQKSYLKTTAAATAKEEAGKEEQAKQEGQAGQEGQEGQEGQAGAEGQAGKSSAEGQKSGEGGQAGQESGSAIPPGVTKVTERITTEVVREYLDAQGKVIGTERSSNQQVRTVPPEMLKKELEQQSQTPAGGGAEVQGEGNQAPTGQASGK